MKTIFKGVEINTNANFPRKGTIAPDFELVKRDLSTATLKDFLGKKIILNIFPSLDTPTCATSVRKFNKEAAKIENTVVLCISKDLPFAQDRFCTTEGIENVTVLSEFRNNYFSTDYGVRIVDSPMQGLMARAVIVLDSEGFIRYKELVPDISREPNYRLALHIAENIACNPTIQVVQEIF